MCNCNMTTFTHLPCQLLQFNTLIHFFFSFEIHAYTLTFTFNLILKLAVRMSFPRSISDELNQSTCPFLPPLRKKVTSPVLKTISLQSLSLYHITYSGHFAFLPCLSLNAVLFTLLQSCSTSVPLIFWSR